MTAREILLVLKRRWWLIVAGTLVAGSVAAALSLLWPHSYEAEATLLITKLRPVVNLDPRFQTLTEENIVTLSIQEEQVRRQTLIGLASSPKIASLVVDRLGDSLPLDERLASAVGDMIEADTVGNVISIRAHAGTPQRAAQVATAWAQIYAAYVNKLYSTTSPSDAQIQAQLVNARTAYEQSEADLEAFLSSSTELELARRIEQKKEILTGLQTGQLAAARRRINHLLDGTNRIDRLLVDARNLRQQLSGAPEGTVPSAGEQMALYALEAGGLAQTAFFSTTLQIAPLTPETQPISTELAIDHLDRLVTTLQAARNTAQQEIADQSSALLAGGELLSYDTAGSGQDGVISLQGEISALTAELQQQTWKKQVLTDDQEVARDTYLTVARKAAEIQMLSELTGVEVQVAAPATEPNEPAFPRPAISVALGLVAGALLGLALSFLLEFWPREGSPAP